MLKTNINLYRSFQEPTPTNTFLNWKQFLFLNMAFVGLMVLVTLSSIIQYLYVSHDHKKVMAIHATLEKQYNILKAKFPPSFFSAGVAQTAKQLREQLETQEEIIHSVVNATPFSDSLSILSTIIVPNVWLTEITLEKGGHDITLQGKSINTQNLQNFVKNIFKEKFFAEYTLSINDILNTDKSAPKQVVNFQLSLVKHNP